MKTKVFITGVNGFLGQGMWHYLIRNVKKAELYGADIKSGLQHQNIVKTDLTRKQSLVKLLSSVQPQIVFHLAGGRMADPEASQLANLGTTECLCAALFDLGLTDTKVIIPGSAAEYGIPPKDVRKINERVVPRPKSDYGRIKWQQTQAALDWSQKGLDISIGRIFNIMGAGTPETLAVGRFAQQIALMERRGKEGVLQTYDLSGKRDYIDIQDVCSALWALALKGHSGEIYNICSTRPVAIAALLEKLILMSRLVDVTIDEQPTQSQSFSVIGSHAKIKRDTGWSPVIGLDQSLRDTLVSWRKKV
ncbi:MAG: NAD-dependent epimerase/dehydratase family protein [Candidatus Omnitrophica bacterium]|nr:NAD-dependent epimerase/dehydratase family protein [Candidatus Omnitrophota bacterium]